MRRWAALAAAALMAVALPLASAAQAVGAGSTAAPASVDSSTVGTVSVRTATTGGLSDSGQQAIADLRTCLASNDVLNVYYLVDSSRSLAVADGGGPGSDPDMQRAAILANSLEQLGAIGNGTTVNWAAGFFSTDFSEAIGWQTWAAGGAGQLSSAIKAKTPSGYTNWPAALAGAQSQLAAQQQTHGGCQMLVWLTDGLIDIKAPDGQGPEDRDALNALCGAQLDPSGASASGYGIFNAMRQSGVVVIGALLATTDAAGMAGLVMQPLVEGTGTVNGRTVSCGEQPMPTGYAHGAFVEASSPDALAQVFLQLSAQVGGGYPQPFDADGSFWVDQGVARFRIVLSGDWTLTPPSGSGLAAASASSGQSWLKTTDQNGATVIDVTTDAASAHGKWKLDAGSTKSLFLYSDLGIVFDAKNAISIGADGQASAQLKAQVQHTDGTPADLTAFTTRTFTARLVGSDGTVTALPDAQIDPATGSISIPIPTTVSTATVTVEASIDPLQTVHNTLAPITTQQRVATVLPAEFPRVSSALPVALSTLEGRDGTATGEITVAGPTAGGDGTVCIASPPTITSDAGSRAGDTWQWKYENCVTVAQGSTAVIPISVTNGEAADSRVRASAPITFTSAAGDALTQEVPIVFTSTRPVNAAAVGLLALALLLLGILLPLVLLWIVNWATTRLEVDNRTQRAAFRVRIGPDGVEFVDAPASDSALSERFGYRGAAGSGRSIDDPELGGIHTRIPWFPLLAPQYVITPAPGTLLVVARAGSKLAAGGASQADGSMRFAQLPLGAFWALTVSRAELLRTRRGDAVVGTAVIYHRFDASVPTQYRDRLDDIAADPRLTDAIDRLRTAQTPTGSAIPGPAAPGEAPPVDPLAGVPPRTSASGAGSPPPRPGGSSSAGSPPPLPGSPPSLPGAAPARPSHPPARPGAAPPRPSASPRSDPPPRGR
ncbi:MAG: hypothetical protein KKH75_03780 [Actinobacteria bacterium]|nr:hypothetical protein [Actinomycetota bacterium]